MHSQALSFHVAITPSHRRGMIELPSKKFSRITGLLIASAHLEGCTCVIEDAVARPAMIGIRGRWEYDGTETSAEDLDARVSRLDSALDAACVAVRNAAREWGCTVEYEVKFAGGEVDQDIFDPPDLIPEPNYSLDGTRGE